MILRCPPHAFKLPAGGGQRQRRAGTLLRSLAVKLVAREEIGARTSTSFPLLWSNWYSLKNGVSYVLTEIGKSMSSFGLAF